jgi:hypothetical protein
MYVHSFGIFSSICQESNSLTNIDVVEASDKPLLPNLRRGSNTLKVGETM